MLPLENESVEALRDARLFHRWIKEGKLTVEQARAEILVTPRQLEIVRADHDSHVLATCSAGGRKRGMRSCE